MSEKSRQAIRRMIWPVILAGTAFALVAGGMAVASIPDAKGVLHACYSTKTGAVRLIDTAKKQKCETGEKSVSWNQAGRPGPAGPASKPDLARVAKLDWWGGPYAGGHYGFDQPVGVAFDGSHIWVTNET